jgi:hypothetical protein
MLPNGWRTRTDHGLLAKDTSCRLIVSGNIGGKEIERPINKLGIKR